MRLYEPSELTFSQLYELQKEYGEGIYGTTFWKTFGEGSVNAEAGFFKDGDEKAFTEKDFRFTYKDCSLYVFQMRPSKNVKIRTLRKHNPHDYLIEKIEKVFKDKPKKSEIEW